MIPVVDVRCSHKTILVTLADSTEYALEDNTVCSAGKKQPSYMRNSLRTRVRAFSSRDLPEYKRRACSFALARLESVNT